MSVCNGKEGYIVPPHDIANFLYLHRHALWIFHNAAFDYQVIVQHLNNIYREDLVELFQDHVEFGKVYDTMLLDCLHRLAWRDEFPSPRNLGIVAKIYADHEVDKNDPFRLRYGEVLLTPFEKWDQLEVGFWEYAIGDAVATYFAGVALIKRCGQHNKIRKWGLLSHDLQLMGAISLYAMTTRGLVTDLSVAQGQSLEMQKAAFKSAQLLESQIGGDVFKRPGPRQATDPKLEHRISPEGWLLSEKMMPQKKDSVIKEALENLCQTQNLEVPRTGTGAVSTARDDWEELRGIEPFIDTWLSYTETTKLLQFFQQITTTEVHPRYSVMVRTGRTSCSGPNVQQLPRRGRAREMFVPREGHVFLAIDYAAIELRALAIVCEQLFGFSKLGEVFREGVDPHAYSAAMVNNLSIEKYEALPKAKKKNLRQAAKAVNFGLGGGLGAASLAAYAKTAYGVDMSVEQAAHMRDSICNTVYPELGRYLTEDTRLVLAANLGANVEDVKTAFPEDWQLFCLSKILKDQPIQRDGQPYSEDLVLDLVTKFHQLNHDIEVSNEINRNGYGHKLNQMVFGKTITTLTGRVRNRVSYTQYRNTPFQGLAADGAKLAMWKLEREGYRTVAFIHDEFIIELPIDRDHAAVAATIESLVSSAMLRVFGTSRVPVECEFALMDRWYKDAEAVYDDSGQLLLWMPDGQHVSPMAPIA